MFKQNLKVVISIFVILFIGSCAVDDSANNNDESGGKGPKNTLEDQLQGLQGAISEYFYNFEDDVDATYFRYNPNLMSNYKSYSDYYDIFGSDPTTMSFRTFPNHLVAMNPSDESKFTKRNYIDSLSVVDSVVYDSVQMTSTPFKNLESLEWNLLAQPSLQRYKLVNSSWVVSDTMLFYNDTFDISAYWAVVDTPFIDSGLLFVDSSEWNDTDYVFISDDPFRFVNTFEFTKKQLSSDSLVFRINKDCNDNGTWDESEGTLVDYNGNGVYEALYEYADNNHVKFITALFEGDPDGNDDDSWPTCAEWGQLPGTNFDNLVSAQIVDDNDFGLFNMFNSQNSIPSTVWLDHEMRVHKLGNNLNAWHINYNINEMLESCGSLCDPLIGDVDGDGLLNIVDIIIIVDFIINDIYIQNADANNDNSVDIFDILILVNSILG